MADGTTTERDLSVVVFGATGIAGRNVAAYLAERAAESDFGWAAAGRDPRKIDRVLGEIGVSAPETIAADVGDAASLARMAERARVVLNLVGPYTLYGTPVIEACVTSGTHYADLTGEMPFVRRTIDAFHERAETAGVKVVQVCGFEALPPDLAVELAAETARERWGEELTEAEVEVALRQPEGSVGLADAVSGGTLQGTPAVLADEHSERVSDVAALITDPELAEKVRGRSPISVIPRFNSQGDVIAPMTPAAYINPAVIQRTADLMAAERGAELEPFRYREGLAVSGPGATLPVRYAAAWSLAGLQAGVAALTRARPAVRRRVASGLRRLLPSSGFGPTGPRLADWSWHVSVEARSTGGHYLHVEVDADGHPGYLTTGRMLGEAGLLLAEDGATPDRAGCLTPALALGTGHLDRFERAGLRFSVAS